MKTTGPHNTGLQCTQLDENQVREASLVLFIDNKHLASFTNIHEIPGDKKKMEEMPMLLLPDV